MDILRNQQRIGVHENNRPLGLTRPATYRIEIEGYLDANRAAWFEGMDISAERSESGSPVTIMTGNLVDQAMLHSILTKIRDLGLPLLTLRRIASERPRS